MNEKSSYNLIFGGITAVLGIGGAIAGLRYFRSEDEDLFDFDDFGPTNLSCPSCGGLITINTNQRPIQVGCPMCQSQFIIRE